jgi:hypothetical protein
MPTPSTPPPLSTGEWKGQRLGVVLMDQSSWDDTLADVGPLGPSLGDAVSFQSSRDKRSKRSPKEIPDMEGRAISGRLDEREGRR